MSALYIVRFDDICPTMNWETWNRIERILDENHIKPILAVVPDNQDPSLVVSETHIDFWDKVRLWQNKGWSIGLHGFQHVYKTSDPGLIGLNSRSEFAGQSIEEQSRMLDQALEIFEREKVIPESWVAPAHSFDKTTVRLLIDRGVNVISDGYFNRIVHYLGAIWVPQQIWRFRFYKSGIWTVCYHHNDWSETMINQFEQDILTYKAQIHELGSVIRRNNVHDIQIKDMLFALIWRITIRSKNYLKKIKTFVKKTNL